MDLYASGSGGYPARLEDLLEPDAWGWPTLERLPMDAWGNPYRYVLREDGYPVVISLGADGRAGGEGKAEDISSVTAGLIPSVGG